MFRQGYLSFWNDNISYALRGCILIELALRRRIALVRDPNRRRIPITERIVEVIDDRQTGETILDEALKMMKAQQEVERMSINSWIDLLSGTEVTTISELGIQHDHVISELEQISTKVARPFCITLHTTTTTHFPVLDGDS